MEEEDAFSKVVKATMMKLSEEAKKKERQSLLNKKRLQAQPFEMPSDSMIDFGKHFLYNEVSNIIFVDKSWDALSLLMREDTSIFIQRPRRFGKSTFMRFLRFLCIYGLDYKDLKEKYSTLQIFHKDETPEVCIFSSHNYLPIYLDFSRFNVNASLDNQISDALKGQIRILIDEFLKMDKPEHSEMLKVLSDINRRCDSEDCPNNILQKFDIFLTLNYKVILLIDEYESPILAKLSMFNDKSILESDLKLYEKNYALFFSTVKSFCGQGIVSKIIMTGVISLLHLGIFSGANNFQNLSYEKEFKTTFGFSFEEIKQNLNIKNIIIHLLSKHQFLNETDDDEVKNEKFDQYLREMFK